MHTTDPVESPSSNSTQKILFCNCSYSDVVEASTKRDVLAALVDSGANFEAVPDLCGMAARRDPTLLRLAAAEHLTIVACHPRAVRWLFHIAGAPFDDRRIKILNMRTQSAREIVERLPAAPLAAGVVPKSPSLEKDDPWVPWFPVIDYDRCVNCKQCMNFCLFGTFSLSEDGTVVVSSPSSCKTNCPACGRICPQVAIIFPKYPDAPINGAPIEDEKLERANVKINMNEILGSDVYAALAARRKRAKTRLLKTESVERAIAERKAWAHKTGLDEPERASDSPTGNPER